MTASNWAVIPNEVRDLLLLLNFVFSRVAAQRFDTLPLKKPVISSVARNLLLLFSWLVFFSRRNEQQNISERAA
jgi:hypothetical protein